jgi:ABC-type sugar transport system substrate-binding protein
MTGRLATAAAALIPFMLGLSAADAAKIGIVVETFGNPFQACVRDAAEAEAAKHEGTEVQVLAGTSGADVAVMVRLIEDLVQSKVDVIAFMASDAEVMAGVAKKVQDAGTPVLIHLDDTKEPVARHFVGPDQEAGEAAMAKILAEAIGGSGKVAIIEGQPGNMSSEVRKKGAQDMFAKYPNIEVVGVWNGGWDRALGLKVSEDILTAHPDLKAIAAVNDEMAFGALQAVRSRGLEGQVLITGFNGTAEAIQAVEKGALQGTVLTFCAGVGTQIVRTALDVIAGTDSKEYLIDTGAVALDTKLVKAISDALAAK